VVTAAVDVLGGDTVLDSPALDSAARPGTGAVEHAETTVSPSTVAISGRVRFRFQVADMAAAKHGHPGPLPASPLDEQRRRKGNIRTAYAEEHSVEVMDTISHGEVVSYRFEVVL
jgi:hypothetical protein